MMPEDGLDQIRGHDAIFLGAVGLPAKVPDHISLWGLLIRLRRELPAIRHIRPVRLMPGIRSPLADRKPATSTSLSFARTTRASIPPSAGGASRAPTTRSYCRRASSPAVASTGSCATPSSSPAPGRRSTSPRQPSQTASSSPCPTGTSASRRWRRSTRTSHRPVPHRHPDRPFRPEPRPL